jgi:hypothetical protein
MWVGYADEPEYRRERDKKAPLKPSKPVFLPPWPRAESDASRVQIFFTASQGRPENEFHGYRY